MFRVTLGDIRQGLSLATALLLVGIFLSSCADQTPLTALEEAYFQACQKGNFALAEGWAGGFSGTIVGEEKANRLRRLQKNATNKCDCIARRFSEVLTVEEYRSAIQAMETMSSAHAGRMEGSYNANWTHNLTANKMERLTQIEQRCPALLDGIEIE